MQKGSERSSSFYTENHGALNTEAEDSENLGSLPPLSKQGRDPGKCFRAGRRPGADEELAKREDGRKGKTQEADASGGWTWWWGMWKLACPSAKRALYVAGSGWRWCVSGILNVGQEAGWAHGTFLLSTSSNIFVRAGVLGAPRLARWTEQ